MEKRARGKAAAREPGAKFGLNEAWARLQGFARGLRMAARRRKARCEGVSRFALPGKALVERLRRLARPPRRRGFQKSAHARPPWSPATSPALAGRRRTCRRRCRCQTPPPGRKPKRRVIGRVAVDDDGAVAHLPAQRERVAHQRRARAHALIDRQHAQRAEGDGGHVLDARAAVKDAGGDLRAVGGHKIQLRQKVLVRAQSGGRGNAPRSRAN